jgi:hypothetical protein
LSDEAAQISKLVAELATANSARRLQAATQLYARGTALGAAAIEPWLRDAELSELLLDANRKEGAALAATVGVAVQPANFVRIRACDGSLRLADVPPDQDALELELKLPGGIHLDILTTKAVAGRGAIARYLEKFGEGIQQIEYLVSDVDRATALLREHFSQEAIYPATRAGADKTRVNFFLVRAPGGNKVLIELVQFPAGA